VAVGAAASEAAALAAVEEVGAAAAVASAVEVPVTAGDANSVHPWMRQHFRDGDLEKISKAVDQAEKNTSGDIVPMVVHRSIDTGHVPQVLFLVLYVVALLIGIFVSHDNYDFNLLNFAGAACVVSLLVAVALAKIEWIQRCLVSASSRTQEVHLRAELEFYRNHFDQTKNHGAVLLFVSLLEKRAVFLCDEALSKKLSQKAMDDLAAGLVKKVKHGQLLEGLLESIQKTGELLALHLPPTADQKHELSGKLRIED
jgi:putative membrane protein